MTSFPSGPRGWLRNGALLSFPRDPRAFRRVSQRFGDLSSFVVGRQRFFLINHPDLVREVFVTKADAFVKGWGPVAGNSALGHGLLTAEGALHRQQRRLVLPAVHRQRLEEYASIVIDRGRELTSHWCNGADIDVIGEARGVALKILGETLFGADLSDVAPRIGAAVRILFDRFSGRMHPFAPLVRRIRFRNAAIGAQARFDLHEIARELIASRRSTHGPDLISMLLDARDEAGEPLSDDQLRDEVVTFFVAGHETVALALAWSFALLARDPSAEARLHEELDTILGDRDPQFDDLKRLPYAQGVIAEGLRLFPPQWMLGRRAMQNVRIGDADIPRNAIVLLNLFALHRDARWFDEPDAFRPERWANGVDKSAAPFTYLPFGLSTRRCVGEGFAWMESTLLLALVAKRCRVQPLAHDAQLDPLLLLRPKLPPMRFTMRFTPRAASQ